MIGIRVCFVLQLLLSSALYVLGGNHHHPHVVASRRNLATTRPFRGGSSASTSFRVRNPTKLAPKHGISSSTTTRGSNNGRSMRMRTKEVWSEFLSRDSRNTFIARVYAILAGQLLITAGSIYLFGTRPTLSESMRKPGWGAAVPILSLCLSTIAWFIMNISLEARRKSPVKWQILSLFTLGEAISVGFVSSFYKFQSVMSAMMATAVAASGVSLYTLLQKNPKYDLTQWGSTLSSLGLIFMFYGLITLLQLIGVLPSNFLPYNEMVYGIVGATLFSFYMAYHSRYIVGGNNAHHVMNEKDYVFGAMTLYNDVINIFIYLLKAIGEDKEKH